MGGLKGNCFIEMNRLKITTAEEELLEFDSIDSNDSVGDAVLTLKALENSSVTQVKG